MRLCIVGVTWEVEKIKQNLRGSIRTFDRKVLDLQECEERIFYICGLTESYVEFIKFQMISMWKMSVWTFLSLLSFSFVLRFLKKVYQVGKNDHKG